ncbi:hypothetical protein EV200_1163 [Pedobacter psychrotolerans]|uniref:Uncharacterized protein n=1 Tax=Pedobacter psychrotolerans TaxID=1843235 RepID=A0A4V2RY38_9SPHI|nr:hypothetical protein [Pedobacter psychrotolerans]TCO17540.1 hypothetical protein EV200_1163 [Pedobacter psychrotolerans]GGE71350.1 hypothetical protein GCM10011413_42650 [Pedobacter psychrotolerans]
MKYLFFLLVFASGIASAQNTSPKIEKFFISTLEKGAKSELYSLTKKNFVYFYPIAYSFDETGGIDSLYFSEKTDTRTKELFGLNHSLLIRMKKHNYKYKELSKKIVLVLFYHYRGDDDFVDYSSGFLKSLENIIPEAVQGKDIIILKPITSALLPDIYN